MLSLDVMPGKMYEFPLCAKPAAAIPTKINKNADIRSTLLFIFYLLSQIDDYAGRSPKAVREPAYGQDNRIRYSGGLRQSKGRNLRENLGNISAKPKSLAYRMLNAAAHRSGR